MSEHDVAKVGALLCQHLGLEVSSIGTASVLAAIMERVHACKIPLSEYAAHVDHDRAERDALVDAIIVPESWFFRDRVPFQNLALHAQQLVRKGRRVRVLSAPCSTGEEPYSVAMSLVEAGIDASVITIDAIDVSPRLIAYAQAGTYRATSFRGVDERLRAAYFTRSSDPDSWVLAEEIRRMVRFHARNLLAPHALAGEAPYDIILCRNLLIYLTADARTRLLGSFIRVLVDGGLLVVGHAEALEVIDRRFQNIGIPSAFTYVARGSNDDTPIAVPPAQSKRKLTPAPGRVVEQRTPQPRPPLGKPPAGDGGGTPAVSAAGQQRGSVDALHEANKLANRGQLGDAATLVEAHLARSGADANGWALLGSIRQASGDLTRAEDCFSRAVYCDPAMYTALVQLALLLEKRGEAKGAQQLRARAERAKAGR